MQPGTWLQTLTHFWFFLVHSLKLGIERNVQTCCSKVVWGDGHLYPHRESEHTKDRHLGTLGNKHARSIRSSWTDPEADQCFYPGLLKKHSLSLCSSKYSIDRMDKRWLGSNTFILCLWLHISPSKHPLLTTCQRFVVVVVVLLQCKCLIYLASFIHIFSGFKDPCFLVCFDPLTIILYLELLDLFTSR